MPLGEELAKTSVRRQVQRIVERTESELGQEQVFFIERGQRDWNQLPRPDPPLTVGLDGGYVHARRPQSRTEGWFEVIAGKSQPAQGPSKCFAFVHSHDAKPKRRLFEVLKAQGLQMNQQATFLTDGGDTVREPPLYLCPESEHYLDWFHVTMRLTVMGQTAKGLAQERKPTAQTGEEEEGRLDATALGKQLESLKRFHHDIEADQAFVPDYGERRRHGETITTSFVESTVNQVASKRMVKKQRMRWAQRGRA